MKLSKRTILITGGSSGIGLELAKQLLARDNVVIVTGRNEQALEAAERLMPRLYTLRSDVSDADGIRRLHGAVTERFPELDTLVNNAGIMRMLRLNEQRPLEDVTREVDVDLTGPIRMVQQFLPHLLSRPRPLVVNVSSSLAFVPLAMSPVYSAAKAAMHAYTRCLRRQLSDTDATVVELAPPLTETPLFTPEFAAALSGQKGMAVDVLVRRVIAAVEAGKTEISPGQSNLLKLAGRIAPDLVFRGLSRSG